MMFSQEEINEIIKNLNQMEGKPEYWFHRQTFLEVHDRLVKDVQTACFHLFNDGHLSEARQEFLKIAAMCLIAADTADIKNNEINMLRRRCAEKIAKQAKIPVEILAPTLTTKK